MFYDYNLLSLNYCVVLIIVVYVLMRRKNQQKKRLTSGDIRVLPIETPIHTSIPIRLNHSKSTLFGFNSPRTVEKNNRKNTNDRRSKEEI